MARSGRSASACRPASGSGWVAMPSHPEGSPARLSFVAPQHTHGFGVLARGLAAARRSACAERLSVLLSLQRHPSPQDRPGRNRPRPSGRTSTSCCLSSRCLLIPDATRQTNEAKHAECTPYIRLNRTVLQLSPPLGAPCRFHLWGKFGRASRSGACSEGEGGGPRAVGGLQGDHPPPISHSNPVLS